MKKLLITLIMSLPLTVFSSTLVILECELLEGGTIEDVKRINSEWVKSVNKLNDKKVSSQVLEAVLADGAARADAIASPVLSKVKEMVGFST